MFVKGAIWQHCVTESLFLLTDHAHSRLRKFLYVSLVWGTPTTWRNQLPGGKMVSRHQSVQSYVKCCCMIIFKELPSKGFGERHEKFPDWEDCRGYFLCSPAAVAAFWSVNACALMAGVRLDTDCQVPLGGADPVGRSYPLLWHLEIEGLLFARFPSPTPVRRPPC